MDIESLLAEHADYYDPLKKPIGIAFTEADAERWSALNRRLESIDRRLKLAMFARKKIKAMMSELEAWADQYDANDPALSSSVIRGPEASL